MKITITSDIDESWDTVPRDLHPRIMAALRAFGEALGHDGVAEIEVERMPGEIDTTHFHSRARLRIDPPQVAEDGGALSAIKGLAWTASHGSGIVRGHESFAVRARRAADMEKSADDTSE